MKISNFFNVIKNRKLDTIERMLITDHIGDQVILAILTPFFSSRIPTLKESIKYLRKIYCPPTYEGSIAYREKKSIEYDLQIVLPVYNSENYIQNCLYSILNQDTKYNVCLNIVDDGSKDNSLNIINQIIKNNSNQFITVKVIHQQNKGFSGARNKGLENIVGKYIMFVDSDDMICDNAINNLLDVAFEHDADLVNGSAIFFDDASKWSGIKYGNNKVNKVFKEITGYPWGKVYKYNIWENVKFPVNYWFEDTVIPYRIFPKIKNAYTISDFVYKYRKNPNGITSKSKNNIKSLDSFNITAQLLKEVSELQDNMSQELYEFTLNQIVKNEMRIRNFNFRIQKSIFILSCYLRDKYFENYKIKNDNLKNIELALKNKDYPLFYISCRLLDKKQEL